MTTVIRKFHDESDFWAHVAKAGADDCWLWTGYVTNAKTPYGGMHFRGKQWAAHRLSWVLTNGPIPGIDGADYRGTCVLHRCDTPLCVNPRHLFLGTHLDNMHDKVRKARTTAMKAFCKHGHARTPENLYTSKDGPRACRECHRLREQERRSRLRGNKEQRTSSS